MLQLNFIIIKTYSVNEVIYFLFVYYFIMERKIELCWSIFTSYSLLLRFRGKIEFYFRDFLFRFRRKMEFYIGDALSTCQTWTFSNFVRPMKTEDEKERGSKRLREKKTTMRTSWWNAKFFGSLPHFFVISRKKNRNYEPYTGPEIWSGPQT